MQLPQYFPDLRDERCISAIAIVHSRFSTNTFPSWPLAHPFRFVAHNGEINTVRGNRNRMHAREAMLASSQIPGDLCRLSPICTPEASDSASFDEVLELLHLGGRSLPHAVLMMIPEAWENNTTMDPAERAFWQFHASLMEPWDGPACVTFTDGTLVGAVLDRNGLRPGRWWRTIDDRIILASESGVLDVPSAEIVAKGRLQPGKMFLIDTAQGRIVSDDEIKEDLASEQPYGEWLHAGLLDLKTLPERVRVATQPRVGRAPPGLLRLHRGRPPHPAHPDGRLRRRAARLDGHRHPDRRAVPAVPAALRLLRRTLRPGDQPAAGRHPRRDRHLDGPGDGPRAEPARADRRVVPPDRAALARSGQRRAQQDRPHQRRRRASRPQNRRAARRSTTSNAAAKAWPTRSRISRHRASEAIAKGARTLVISDRDSDHTRAPIPSLLAVSAVHHHLVRTKERTTVALVVESGDAREVHHIAMLIGFGAAAVNPYLAFESIEDLIREGELTGIEPGAAVRNYLKALGKGVMKVMSKMGISTVASYTAAQAFEAIGLDKGVVDEYFTGTPANSAASGWT